MDSRILKDCVLLYPGSRICSGDFVSANIGLVVKVLGGDSRGVIVVTWIILVLETCRFCD